MLDMEQILLCGNSVLIAGLDFSLMDDSQFNVYRIEDLSMYQDVGEIGFIIADTNYCCSNELISEFQHHPNATIVHIDANSGMLITEDGLKISVQSIQDILQWLRNYRVVTAPVSG